MKIYLDTSVFNRPFDDQKQSRIFLETQATIFILQLIEKNEIELVNSTPLQAENDNNPYEDRREEVKSYFLFANEYQAITDEITTRAKELEKVGVKPLDSLHVACAEASKCDYFLTVDDRLQNKQAHFHIKCANPIDFIRENQQWN